MEALLFLGLIVLLIIIVTGNNRLQAQLRNVEVEMSALQRQLQQFLKKADEGGYEPAQAEAKPKPVLPETRRSPQEEIRTKPEAPVPPAIQGTPAIPAAEAVVPEHHAAVIPEAGPTTSPAIPPINIPPPPPRPGFFERNPDLEKFIGENLISKIGIAILVIAIGFFVKYAIDQDWIGPAGRVGIGMLSGGILVGLAHKLQRGYKAFSSVLVGGGLAVLYFSIALAYKDYGLFSQAAAFIIMVVITAFAILLSLLYDRQEVAIISLVGGFAVPFLVSDGSGNYVTLFTYLLLLNVGLLIIAYQKAWRLLNAICFGATALLFGGWLGTLKPATPRGTYIGGIAFATAFYLLFLAINLAHNIRERKKFIASDFGILLADNCLYFTAGLILLYKAEAAQFKGLFSAGLGMLNFVLAAVLIRRRNIDSTILYLLVGITLTFVSLTAPLQLQGHSITLFWAAESVVLLWLQQQSGIRILQWGLLVVWLCCGISLLMDWADVYAGTYGPASLLPVISNKGFMTTLFVAAANAALYRLLQRDVEHRPFVVFDRQMIARIFGGVALALLFMAGALETGYQFSHRYPRSGLSGLYLKLYTLAFVLLLWLLWRRQKIRMHWAILTALMAACLFFYLIGISHAHGVQETMLTTGKNLLHFIAHWTSATLGAIIFYQLLQSLRARLEEPAYRTLLTWSGAVFAVIFVSVEMNLLIRAIAYNSQHSLGVIDRNYVRVGLPIIWGLCSFVLMWLGMRHKFRPLRIVSLTLFSITLLKLFLFDIRHVGVAGKIAAFFSLGVLLLVVSFMYQRLKRLIIEDERKTDAQ